MSKLSFKIVLLYTRMKIHILQFLYRVILTSTLYTCIVIANCLKKYFANYQFYNVVKYLKDKIQNS